MSYDFGGFHMFSLDLDIVRRTQMHADEIHIHMLYLRRMNLNCGGSWADRYIISAADNNTFTHVKSDSMKDVCRKQTICALNGWGCTPLHRTFNVIYLLCHNL